MPVHTCKQPINIAIVYRLRGKAVRVTAAIGAFEIHARHGKLTHVHHNCTMGLGMMQLAAMRPGNWLLGLEELSEVDCQQSWPATVLLCGVAIITNDMCSSPTW